MPSNTGLMDLARHLRQEYLFISSERQNLQNLNEKVMRTVEQLYHLSWIVRQQRVNLENFILCHKDENPVSYCQRANMLETVNFIDSYKQLGVNDSMYSEFLQQLRENPKLLAVCLNAGEQINIPSMNSAVGTIMSTIYGNCILPEDEVHVLNMLKELMMLQLSVSDNPRRLLRHGSCAFSRVYKTFNEYLFSAKIFLTAALYEPIMHVLMDDDLFLDIDPSKAAVRFHPQERLRHFGKEGTQEYASNLQRHRTWIINKLYNLTMHFINGIRNNLCCFPQSLSWLARQMYHLVTKAKRVEVREVGAMCADLVFAFFICPAIVNPAPYGITDIHISDIARFNLMQVAQILQVLAMSKWEEIDSKLMDLYGKFEKDCMSSLLDLILEGTNCDMETGLVNQYQELNRSAILIMESELMALVAFLKNIENGTQDSALKKALYSLNNHFPPPNLNVPTILQNGDILCTSTPSTQVDSHSNTKKSFLGKVGKKSSKFQVSVGSISDNHLDDSSNLQESDGISMGKPQLENVLVVPIPGMEFNCPGMLHEEKVLLIEKQKKSSLKTGSISGDDNESGGPEIIEKRTRFSLSQDQESLGTSDNLEAISEGASNQSVASSVDLENDNDENENDNLSDMVSANVSGRGTPNVSGRDTPSSQAEGEEREQRPIDFVPGPRKQCKDDIEDKFGKFEIQPLIEGDETRSMVSDTWSTDVLASDSETVEQSDVRPPALESQNLSVFDVSETASQSDAWSTDVLASDTERLLDVDTDDTASVARSDDTGRSEADGEVPQGLDITPMDGKDFMDMEHASDPTSGDVTKVDSYSDYSVFLPRRHPSGGFPSDNTKINAETFQKDVGESRDLMAFPDRNEMKAPIDCSGVSYATEINNFKGHSSTSDIDNLIQLSAPIDGNQSLNDGLSSLGCVSLAVRELSNEHEESNLLDSLQETVNVRAKSDGPAHRSSIADILSLDLTRTLNLHAELCSQESLMKKSESNNSLMDIEKDNVSFAEDRMQDMNVAHRILPFGERGSKRKFTDSGFSEDNILRFSAASVSSSTSSGGSTEATPNSKFPLDADSGNQFLDCVPTKTEALSIMSPPGAIHKSMSFEKSGQNLERQSSDEKFENDKNRKNIFKLTGFKFSFKGKNRKASLPYRPESCLKVASDDGTGKAGRHSTFTEMRALQLEAGEEILAKYRKKSPSLGSSSKNVAIETASETIGNMTESLLLDGNHVFDSITVENSVGFYNAKRKLRLVLGSADLQTLPWQNSAQGSAATQRLQDNRLVAFLKVLLAEAINLQQRPLLSHLREALRCVQMFDDSGCQRLFRSLREDYKKRAPYIAYLVRCRQGLLSTLSHLETLIDRIGRDKQVCDHNLLMMCVRIFLEKQERSRQIFLRKFSELTVLDEKAVLVQNFLNFLTNRMENDLMWQVVNESQVEHAQVIIERIIMGQIYISALHPNGDGDVLRDKVFQEHMQKLSQVITPNHKDLRVPKYFHSECPWPSAQAELDLINAYKTPRDKIQCVVRCCSTIMNLLSMASDKQVPSADDLMPVLVFVLIKANPSNLLSTGQYVTTFYEKNLEGEEAYWWTQFISAVEFIKTMDY